MGADRTERTDLSHRCVAVHVRSGASLRRSVKKKKGRWKSEQGATISSSLEFYIDFFFFFTVGIFDFQIRMRFL